MRSESRSGRRPYSSRHAAALYGRGDPISPRLAAACHYPYEVVNAHPRPYYYLENFSLALEWLQRRYDELLSEQERAFVRDFARLPIESARARGANDHAAGRSVRTSKLLYTEIGCPRRAAVP